MTETNCFEAVKQITEILMSVDGAARFRCLLAENAPAQTYIETFAGLCDSEMGDVVRDEFEALPANVVPVILQAWAMADEAGKEFAIHSIRPEVPLEFARRNKVRLGIETDDDGVLVFISHVPTRHAEWYRPKVKLAV